MKSLATRQTCHWAFAMHWHLSWSGHRADEIDRRAPGYWEI